MTLWGIIQKTVSKCPVTEAMKKEGAAIVNCRLLKNGRGQEVRLFEGFEKGCKDKFISHAEISNGTVITKRYGSGHYLLPGSPRFKSAEATILRKGKKLLSKLYHLEYFGEHAIKSKMPTTSKSSIISGANGLNRTTTKTADKTVRQTTYPSGNTYTLTTAKDGTVTMGKTKGEPPKIPEYEY